MDELIMVETTESPGIHFNPVTGVLKISGRAIANDINVLYKPLDAWLDEYLQQPQEITTIELRLDYVNSMFNKLLFVFLEKSKSVTAKKKKLVIKWFHLPEDEDSVEDANRISKIINVQIDKIEYE
ncbi:MAG: DUF1987 family protein [Bacteroidia bacterium]|nr:DUF1987 family protein [Bacteroidia bacterium]